MIKRYTRPQIGAIWSNANKFKKWLQVELCVCEAQAEYGNIPKHALEIIKQKANFNVKRISEIEQEVKHDVIAFLTNVGEYIGKESRYIHLGMTSSDLLDTAFALLMREAGAIILDDLTRLREEIKKKARQYKNTVCIGRSHGVHAEPTTFGLKMALWFDEVKRNIERFERAIQTISVGKISGAVGTFAHLDPKIEEYVCRKLNLQPAPVSNQIIQRDRYAEYLTTLALIGCSLEKFATEIRNLQRTEILEVEEYFSASQKGSSAMPHKRNPITCERICGLARVVRSNCMAAMENVSLWHERDISHSSVERIIVPDSTILIDYMLHHFIGIIKNLLVYPENMMNNIYKTNGIIFSQAILISLIKKGLSREKAYRLVQQRALDVWHSAETDFKKAIFSDYEISKLLSAEEIENCFDLKNQLKNIDTIFNKVGL